MLKKNENSGIQHDTITLEIRGKPFDFPLCGADEQFGTHKVFHMWMDRRLIYGQRGRSRQLNQVSADYFWEVCQAEHVQTDAEPQQKYLLARLCPYMRGNAAKKIFNDASITFNSVAMRALARQVESSLSTSRNDEMTPRAFYESTAKLLGPTQWPVPTEARMKRYNEIQTELLERPCELLANDAAAANAEAINRWKSLESRYGRRAGYAEEKLILSMLSYESRVAVHDCYGEVWNALLSFFIEQAVSSDVIALHSFLHGHKKYIEPTTGAGYFLFHGQPFSLHPGSGLLFKTKTGRELIGEYLSNLSSEQSLNRLLHAISISLYEYTNYYEDQTLNRKIDSVRTIGYEQATSAEIKEKQGDRREKPKFSKNG